MELLDEGQGGGFVGFVVELGPLVVVMFDGGDGFADGVNGEFGFVAFEGKGGAGLGAVEEHKAAEAFVAGDELRVVAVAACEVEQGEGVLGVGEHAVVAVKGQPGHASLVELDDFAVEFALEVGVHRPGGRERFGACGVESAIGGAVAEVIEEGAEAVGTEAVGPAVDFHLEDAEFLTDLDDPAAIAGADLACDEGAGVGFVGPVAQGVVNVFGHGGEGLRMGGRPVASHKGL